LDPETPGSGRQPRHFDYTPKITSFPAENRRPRDPM
jgi:hypothetical protein